MKIKIAVGDVEIRLDGLDLNMRQISALLHKAGSIALAVGSAPDEPEEPKQPIGFGASIELDPERNYQPDLSEWFEDSQ